MDAGGQVLEAVLGDSARLGASGIVGFGARYLRYFDERTNRPAIVAWCFSSSSSLCHNPIMVVLLLKVNAKGKRYGTLLLPLASRWSERGRGKRVGRREW